MASAQERNTYVKKQITNTLLEMLEKQPLSEITVSTLVKEAKVGRASFYRNYESLEDIIAQYDQSLIQEWGAKFEAGPESSPLNVFASLFQHYKQNEDFYMILFRNDLTNLIRDTIYRKAGPQPGMSDEESYRQAFLAYGIYGMVWEWMKRGMQDIPEDITIFPNGIIL